MKLGSIDRPVTSAWLHRLGDRLDASTFLSGAVEAQIVLDALAAEKQPLYALTAGFSGGIFNGPMFSRTYVSDPEHGVPFMGSSAILQSNLRNLPLLSKNNAYGENLKHLEVRQGMTLISCSGTIGRTVFARPDMAGAWTSQDVLKVQPDPAKVPPGYLFAFLVSRYGAPLVTSGTYGSIIQHIEPGHLRGLTVPRLGSVEVEAHRLVNEAAEARAECQRLLDGSTARVFESVGLRDIRPHEWHKQGPDLGFSVIAKGTRSLRSLNYNPRAGRLRASLEGVSHRALGDICSGGLLERGPRFTRVDATGDGAIRLVGQKQGFWVEPEGRWISRRFTPPEVFVPDETILIAARGTLGENEVFCRAVFATGDWLSFAYTEDYLRIHAVDRSVTGAYLYAFLRSETAFRLFRSASTGSKQQDLQPGLVASLPVPLAPPDERAAIAELVRHAMRLRDEGDRAERAAVALVESAIES